MTENPYRESHAINDDVDLDVAIALELSVTADCGKTFVPKYGAFEAAIFPDCPDCFPKPTRIRGSHRLSSEARGALPHYVYRCYDSKDRLLYVGCSYNPVVRLSQHKAERKNWPALVARTRLTVFPNRRKALDMERLAIETEDPIHNRTFKREIA